MIAYLPTQTLWGVVQNVVPNRRLWDELFRLYGETCNILTDESLIHTIPRLPKDCLYTTVKAYRQKLIEERYYSPIADLFQSKTSGRSHQHEYAPCPITGLRVRPIQVSSEVITSLDTLFENLHGAADGPEDNPQTPLFTVSLALLMDIFFHLECAGLLDYHHSTFETKWEKIKNNHYGRLGMIVLDHFFSYVAETDEIGSEDVTLCYCWPLCLKEKLLLDAAHYFTSENSDTYGPKLKERIVCHVLDYELDDAILDLMPPEYRLIATLLQAGCPRGVVWYLRELVKDGPVSAQQIREQFSEGTADTFVRVLSQTELLLG